MGSVYVYTVLEYCFGIKYMVLLCSTSLYMTGQINTVAHPITILILHTYTLIAHLYSYCAPILLLKCWNFTALYCYYAYTLIWNATVSSHSVWVTSTLDRFPTSVWCAILSIGSWVYGIVGLLNNC